MFDCRKISHLLSLDQQNIFHIKGNRNCGNNVKIELLLLDSIYL